MASKVLIEVIATGKGLKVVAKDTEAVVESTKKLDREQKKTTKSTKKQTDAHAKYDKQNKAVYQGNLSSAKSFSKMKETIGGGSSGLVQAYATLAANVFAATAAFTALRQASQVQQLVEGLQVLGQASGRNLTLLGDRIKEASGNAIALDQALRTASVGASAGFDGSQIEGLASVARQAAIALGRDVGDAVDRLTRGAAKLEPEILDELGIFVRLDDASAKYAASIGVATSELTRFQQRQAFANEIIDQGNRKFGELGDKVDASPFDRLAATLGDLSRTVMDFLNTALAPFAEFLANNTLALAGFFAMLSKGIMNQALPMLNQFAQTAKIAAAAEISRSNAAATRIKREQKATLSLVEPIKGSTAAFNKNTKALKRGDFTTAQLIEREKSLKLSILARQRALTTGNPKTLAAREADLKKAKEQLQVNNTLLNQQRQIEKQAGAAAIAKAGARSKSGEQAVFRTLERDPSVGGFKRAFGLAGMATKRYGKELADATAKQTGLSASQVKLTKIMNIGRVSFFKFGLTAKIAIKGIFTAIPIIGQLLFLFDMLLAGLKSLIGFLGDMLPAQSEASKKMEQLTQATAGFLEVQNEANLKNKGAADSLIISANATDQLIQSTEEASRAQQEAFDKANNFGKAIIVIRRRFSELGDSFSRIFEGMAIGTERFIANLKIAFNDFLTSFVVRNFINFYTLIYNTLIAGEGEKISFMDKDSLDDENKKLEEQIKLIDQRKANRLDKDNLDLGGFNLSTTMPEVQAFETLMKGTGKSTEELKKFIGGADKTINGFLQTLGSATELSNLGEGFVNLSKETDKNGKLTERAEFLQGVLKDGVIDTTEAVRLLSIATKQGTVNTRVSGAATEELGQTFQNSGEKINTFFTSLKEKSNLSPLLSELTNINKIIGSIQRGDEGSNAFAETFEKAPESLRSFIDNGEKIKAIMKSITPGQELTKDQEAEITELRKEGLKTLESTLRTIVDIELVGKKQMALLAQQAKAVGKVKNNSEAVRVQTFLNNEVAKKNIKSLEAQNKINEQNLGIKQGEVLTAQQITDLNDEDTKKYGKILTNRVQIAKEQEKIVTKEEEGFLIRQADLENTKLQNQLTTAQAATLAKSNKLLAVQANIRAGIGGKLTPAQQLRAQKVAASEAVKAAIRDQAFQIAKFNIEKDIFKMRMLAAKVEATEVDKIIAKMETNFETQKKITDEKIKQARLDEKMVGKDQFEGLLSGTFGARQSSAIDLAMESIARTEILDKEGKGTGEFNEATTQERLEALSDATKPMREELMKLGPEGELVAAAQQGILTMASAFDVFMTSTDKADKLAAVGAAIGAVSQIMAANSKAQIAEIDKQIEAEKKRDGKSAESIQKIKAMEKKKEAMQKKAFEQNKKMQMAQTIVNTASGIMKAYSDYDTLTATALAVMIGAMGAAQLAIISKQQFQGGSSGDIEKPNTSLTIGKRSNAVNVSRSATSGELNYLRGGRTTGQDIGGAGGYLPGSAMGRKGYAMGFRRGYADGGVVVGERGPEVITPSTDVDIVPNFALGGGETNINFSINAIDAAGVEDVLSNQRGNIIRMIREAANENGERFLEMVDTQTYGSNT